MHLLQRKFGGSLGVLRLNELRFEMRAARMGVPSPVAQVAIVSNKDDVEAATRLLLDAIPHLRTFTITVDDAGEVTVNHTVRETRVVESSGSLKIRR